MTQKSPFNTLLVPVDFSDSSSDALDQALSWVDGEDSLIFVLHVIDEAVVDLITFNELGERDDVIAKLRHQADGRLAELTNRDAGKVQMDAIVSVGSPFLEIIRKAKDFAVDAIVMSKAGADGQFESLLFGSTAEKVLRGSKCPVIALPSRAPTQE